MLGTVAIRFYSRGFLTHVLGWDDFTCAFAALGTLLATAFGLHSISLGWGNHMWDVRASLFSDVNSVRLMNVPNLLYGVVMYSVKISILIQYYRLFDVLHKLRVAIIIGVIVVSIAHSAVIALGMASLIQCTDQATVMLRPVCVSTVIYLQSSLTVATDFFILLLPIKTILGLQLPRRQKVGTLVVFSAGLMACLVSVARLIATVNLFRDQTDVFYDGVVQSELTNVEMNVAIMTSCATAMPAFYRHLKTTSQSIYTTLRLRLFGHRSPSKETDLMENSRWSEKRKLAKLPLGTLFDDRYVTLLDHPSVAITAVEGPINRSSKDGTLRTASIVHTDKSMIPDYMGR